MKKTDTQPRARVVAAPKGIIDPRATERRIRLSRYHPCKELSPLVQHYWIVEWDMRGRSPELQRVLPHPHANLVFEDRKTALFGVFTGVYEELMDGVGMALGVRFQIGSVRPYLKGDAASIVDRATSAATVIGDDVNAVEREVVSAPDHAAMLGVVERHLKHHLIEPCETAIWLREVLNVAAMEHGPATVKELSQKVDCSERTLQRLFNEYIGVSPKWVLRRFRIHEAAWRISSDTADSLAHLAAELGYSDQAHLSRDFTKYIGCSPSSYRDSQRRWA